MLHLNRRSLVEDKAAWEQAGIALYQFDTEAVEAATKEAPQWIHFGGGNIFRAFIAALQQHLLNEGLAKTGIITAETYDEEVIEHVYRPFDNLSLAVTMYADGRFETKSSAPSSNPSSAVPISQKTGSASRKSSKRRLSR